MEYRIKYISSILIILLLTGCGWLRKKVDEKVDEEVKKTTEEVNKQLKQADSLSKEIEEKTKEEIGKQIIDEEKIINDPDGQWATDANASSSYSSQKSGKEGAWGMMQMTGKPDCETYGDNGNSWASQEQDKNIEWIILSFDKAVNATEIRIRQNYNPGAIIKVEVVDEDGKTHQVWEGSDKTKYKSNTKCGTDTE